MTNFSIGRTFTTVVRIFAELAFFYYLCSLSGGLTSRFWVFWNLVQIDGLIWLKYFAGMFTSLFGSMTSRYCFGKSQFRFTKKTLSQRIVPQTIMSFIKESWRVSISHSEQSFFRSVAKLRNFYPSCCRYVKNVRQSTVMFFLGLQYSENFCNTDASLISSSGLSKLKVS